MIRLARREARARRASDSAQLKLRGLEVRVRLDQNIAAARVRVELYKRNLYAQFGNSQRRLQVRRAPACLVLEGWRSPHARGEGGGGYRLHCHHPWSFHVTPGTTFRVFW